MRLFSTRDRYALQPADHGEDTYAFLDRSGQPAAEKVRQKLQSWFDQYPNSHKLELKRRLQTDFHSALFELVLHALLLSWECELEVHPNPSAGSRKRPDFAVRLPNSSEAYLEALVITDTSSNEAAERARLNTLYDELNKLRLPDYFLQLQDVKNPNNQTPSGKKLRAFLRRKLEGVSHEELSRRVLEYGIDASPQWIFEDQGFEITIKLIPKKPGTRDSGHRPIGIYPGKTRWGGSLSALRRGIDAKATRYGELDRPYVIAVNNLSPWATGSDELLRAMFGSRDIPISSGRPRAPDHIDHGVWYGPTGATNTRVSALFYIKFVIWNLAKQQPILLHNPFARIPFGSHHWSVNQLRIAEGSLVTDPGSTIGDRLKLGLDWPGQLFPDR